MQNLKGSEEDSGVSSRKSDLSLTDKGLCNTKEDFSYSDYSRRYTQ